MASSGKASAEDVEALIANKHPTIRVIALTAMGVQPDLPRHYKAIRAGLIDEPDLSEEAIRLTTAIADIVSSDLAGYVQRGSSVLSSCRAGKNRSGLVSALTLMKVAGMTPANAIATVRTQRKLLDGVALVNPQCEDRLRAPRPARCAGYRVMRST